MKSQETMQMKTPQHHQATLNHYDAAKHYVDAGNFSGSNENKPESYCPKLRHKGSSLVLLGWML